MDSQLIAVAITALVGVVGIVSTHLLARSQRKGDAERQEAERRDRYHFTAHEARAMLYADLIAELRMLVTSARLRVQVVGSFQRKLSEGMSEMARSKAATEKDDELARALLQFADALDHDPELARQIAENRPKDGLPPALDGMSSVRRVTELVARIRVVGGHEAVKAARTTENAAMACLLKLQALELRRLNGELDLAPLEEAIGRFEEAAIYELQLLPFGETESLGSLRKMAK